MLGRIIDLDAKVAPKPYSSAAPGHQRPRLLGRWVSAEAAALFAAFEAVALWRVAEAFDAAAALVASLLPLCVSADPAALFAAADAFGLLRVRPAAEAAARLVFSDFATIAPSKSIQGHG